MSDDVWITGVVEEAESSEDGGANLVVDNGGSRSRGSPD
jgi:hypothetical protein